jgi:hypothetical protein
VLPYINAALLLDIIHQKSLQVNHQHDARPDKQKQEEGLLVES